MPSPLVLSPHSPVPMYAQIVEQVVAKVLGGDWATGQALPSIRELAASSGVSVITVKRAYLELERAGVIVTHQGKGSFVAEPRAGARDARLDGLRRTLADAVAAARVLGLGEKKLRALLDEAWQDDGASKDE